MFYCERCQSSFGETVAAVAGRCPRCLSEDKVTVPLRFRLFSPEALKVAGIEPARERAKPKPESESDRAE